MHFRWERRVQEATLVPLVFKSRNYFKNENFIQFYDKKILLYDKGFKKPISPLVFDYIIASSNINVDLKNIKCKQLIIASSVSKYNREQIKKECLKWEIPFYDVSTEGAYLFEINA